MLSVMIVGAPKVDPQDLPPGMNVRLLRSSKEGGAGRWRSALRALRCGAFDAVYVLRRVGHSEMEALKQAAAAAGVPVIWVSGGMTALKRLVRARLGGVP